MPGHVRAADAPEDLWRCHECGWTYPNHHPSAKHRRNHKKQCGKIPGFMKVTDLKAAPQVGAGSFSDDGSSDEDHHPLSPKGHKKNDLDHEYPQSPSPVAARTIEQAPRNNTDPTPNNDGGAHVTSTVNENSAISAKSFDLPASKVQSPGTLQTSDQGRSTLRSAHAVKGQWSCRHCAWLYPNAHPSAKSRRKHKKICGLRAEHSLPGGSSDEASSSDEERNCEEESSELTGTQESPECNPSVPQESLGAETINEVSSRDLQTHSEKLMVTGHEGADNAQDVPLESGLSYNQVSYAVSDNGGFKTNGHEKLDVVDSQVAMVDEGKIQPTVARAFVDTGAPDASDVSARLNESINSYQSQALGEIHNRTAVSEELKLGELDGAVADRQLSGVSAEHGEKGKPDLFQPSQQNFPQENGEKSSNHLTKEGVAESSSPQSQSPVILGRESFKHPVGGSSLLDVKNKNLNPTTRGAVAGKSPSPLEARSPPESPEGLVRSRVQIFEQLAASTASTPQSRSPRITVSPTVNSASPRMPRICNGTAYSKSVAGSDSNGSLKDPQETMSHLRHHQSHPGRGQSTSKQDAPSELHELMAHLRHRANFVQIECNEVPVEGK